MIKYVLSCFTAAFLIATSPFNIFMPVKKSHAATYSAKSLKKSSAGSSCTHHILHTEKALGIPSGMLLAVSIVETGVGGTPQPYAVHKKGRSYYAKNANHAKSLITYKNGSFMRNTSVGCMQLQTTYHRKKFKSFDEFISPEANVRYGGRYLKRHFKTYGNWSRAVKRYNGGKPARTRRYLCKVHNVLKQIDPSSAKLLNNSACGSSKPYVSHATKNAFRAFYT